MVLGLSMSSAAVSDAKRKRLAALEERQHKSQSAQDSGRKKGPRQEEDKKRQAADKLQPPDQPSPRKPSGEGVLPQSQANLPDPSAFLSSFLGNLLKGNVNRPDDIIETRVRDKIVLLDNPTVGKSRRSQSQAVRSLKHMSLREHRRNHSFDIPPELQRFELYEPLHTLWQEYIEKLTEGSSGQALLTRLLTADYHGAFLSVSASKDPTYVGAEGLVVRETQNTFQIVTTYNRLRVVPKRGSIFHLRLTNNLVGLFGSQLLEERRLLRSGSHSKAKNVLKSIEL